MPSSKVPLIGPLSWEGAFLMSTATLCGVFHIFWLDGGVRLGLYWTCRIERKDHSDE